MSEADDKRRGFFEFVFGNGEGYLCLAFRHATTGAFKDQYYKYPIDLENGVRDIAKQFTTHDVYYCPHLLTTPKRKKENVAECPCVWADLDDCPPTELKVPATVVVMTSEGRYQALWKTNSFVSPEDAEAVSKRIAYGHVDDGADVSGWDLTQLLRVPLTYNHKYKDKGAPQTVIVTEAKPQRKYNIADFSDYPLIEEAIVTEIPMPTDIDHMDAEDILNEYKLHINPKVWDLFEKEPERDWSRAMWELELSLFEGGLTRAEVFVIADAAACNKYRREGRPKIFLWKEVCRAYNTVKTKHKPLPEQEDRPRIAKQIPILSDAERRDIANNPTFVEDYIDWAKGVGDAAWQYHQAGAFIALSTTLSGYLQLPTSFGTLRTNMWFMILADTTLTRKTTAMDLSMDLVREVDSDCVLATDGSIEGLLTSLSVRPGRASVFLRDEFTGLIEQMGKKDYYAGMMEALTKLYDGKYQKRVLRRETIEVKDPLLVVFAGGIKNRMMQLMTYEHVASGFIPRFIFISAESDITKMKPLGPPTTATTARRTELIQRLTTMKQELALRMVPVEGLNTRQPTDARLTDDAWVRYNRIEQNLVESALKSNDSELLTPTMARLSINGLKAAVLLAATKMEDELIVTEEDLIRAFYYVETWREYSMDILTNIGKTAEEQTMDRIFRVVEKNPGVMRSHLMQRFHLTARQADAVFATMEQRGTIQRQKAGRTERLYALEN